MGVFGPVESTEERDRELEITAIKISSILARELKLMNKDLYLSVNLNRSLRLKTISGSFSEHNLPFIENLIIYDNQENRAVVAKKGFIDTGATTTIISRQMAKELKIAPERIIKKKNHISAVGEVEVETVQNLDIRSDIIDLHPINMVIIGNLDFYDIAIGNDVLKNCQFFYEGLTNSYILKSISA